jgi:serine palmitoyltransferase
MIYSSDVATPASTIPAFAKRGDLLLVDDGCSFALQSGVHLSRSNVRYWRHNDVAHLSRLLDEVRAEDKASGRRGVQNRRFIVVEGLYANWGDLAPLEQIVGLKNAHCFRLLVDESHAFGALPGGAGRGACEHAGLPPGAAEIVTGSLGNTLGAVGGFCLGSRQVIAHQRLNASGYCFSASLPPYLAAGALASLAALSAQPELRERLARNAALVRTALGGLRGVAPPAGPSASPLIHLRLAGSKPGDDGDSPAGTEAEALLQRVCARALAAGVLLSTAKYSSLERRRPPPSIRIAVSAEHTEAELRAAVATLRAALAAEGVC